MQHVSALLLVLTAAMASAAALTGSVYVKDGKYLLKQGTIDKSAAAFGSFEDTLNTTGWGVLTISTSPAFSLKDQYGAAGYLEGALTQQRIFEHSQSMNEVFFGAARKPSPAVQTFFKDQQAFAQEQSKKSTEPLWRFTEAILAQFEGLIQGYSQYATPEQALERIDFHVLNSVGDLLDLHVGKSIDWHNLNAKEFKEAVFRTSMCSALIKVTDDFSELFAGHSSWFTYSSMNRIYKHYVFGSTDGFLSATKSSFSSYPGILSSLDDFYMMNNGLVLIQTTNNIFNSSLYDLITPKSLFAWQRVRAANALAKDGPGWYQIFSQYNSGTYNNQYMIVDYNKFTPKQPLPDNLLFLVEQIPGLVVGADLTAELRAGYFPSYNAPYFQNIYNLSGYPEMVAKHGTDYSYQLAPRAKIFRRDQSKVTDLASFKHILRSNDFKHDPFSDGDASKAICARGDENPGGSLGGCYDTKVTYSPWVKDMRSDALNGPTTDMNMPPFEWKASYSSAHYGQPDKFDFSFVPMSGKQAKL